MIMDYFMDLNIAHNPQINMDDIPEPESLDPIFGPSSYNDEDRCLGLALLLERIYELVVMQPPPLD